MSQMIICKSNQVEQIHSIQLIKEFLQVDFAQVLYDIRLMLID